MTPFKGWRIALPFLCAALSCAAWAQSLAQSTAQGRSTPTFHTETSLVLVPTLVTTPQGRVVFGLRAQDFVVTDNGVEQKVQMDETLSGRPVSMVIAVQRGGRAPEALGGGCPLPGRENVFTKQAGKCVSPMHGIAQMLETWVNDAGSEMALVSFDSQVRLRQPFTGNVDEVTKELESLPAGDGGSAILDAIQYSLGLLRRSPADQRRVLIVVSEETDRGSSRISLEEAARQIASTNTEIYMIALKDPESGKDVLRMVARLLGPSLAMLGHAPAGMGGMHGGASHESLGHESLGREGLGREGLGQEGTGPLTGAASSAAIAATKADKRAAANSGDDSLENSSSRVEPGQGLNAVQASIPLSHSGEQSKIPQAIANLTGGEFVLFSDSRGLDEALGLLANHAHNRYQLSYRVNSGEPGLHRISVGLREEMGVYVAARTSYWLTAPADHPTAVHPAEAGSSAAGSTSAK